MQHCTRCDLHRRSNDFQAIQFLLILDFSFSSINQSSRANNLWSIQNYIEMLRRRRAVWIRRFSDIFTRRRDGLVYDLLDVVFQIASLLFGTAENLSSAQASSHLRAATAWLTHNFHHLNVFLWMRVVAWRWMRADLILVLFSVWNNIILWKPQTLLYRTSNYVFISMMMMMMITRIYGEKFIIFILHSRGSWRLSFHFDFDLFAATAVEMNLKMSDTYLDRRFSQTNSCRARNSVWNNSIVDYEIDVDIRQWPYWHLSLMPIARQGSLVPIVVVFVVALCVRLDPCT